MNRRAMTLIELSAVMAIGALVIGGALHVLRPLQRMAAVDTSRGVRAEMACDQLRRDAVGNSIVSGATGLAFIQQKKAIVWRVEEGQLLRNDRPMVAVTAFAHTQNNGWVEITLTPQGLPQRRLDIRP